MTRALVIADRSAVLGFPLGLLFSAACREQAREP